MVSMKMHRVLDLILMVLHLLVNQVVAASPSTVIMDLFILRIGWHLLRKMAAAIVILLK
jgi:hypothetical protein